MSQHLSSDQISQWMIGDRSPELAQHVHNCAQCAAEVAQASESIALFGSAVRDWSERQVPAVHLQLPAQTPRRFWNSSMFRWQIATASMAALLIAAIPVYRHQQESRLVPASMVASAGVSDEALLRDVEASLSRSVPTPMEPLADLMTANTGSDRNASDTRRSE